MLTKINLRCFVEAPPTTIKRIFNEKIPKLSTLVAGIRMRE